MFNQKEHRMVIDQVLDFLNKDADNPYVLKGGTSLMKCYNLDRFSEDIDLDAPGETTSRDRFRHALIRFCEQNHYDYRIAKDTETTGRMYIHYGNEGHPLKVEVSYRKKSIPESEVETINGVKVYNLNELSRLKALAYMGRDAIRDLYDVSFICSEYFDELNDEAKKILQTAFEYKDLEQFDYLVRTQDDPLIDKSILETRFLEAFDKLGLLTPKREEIQDEPDEAISLGQEKQDCMAAAHDSGLNRPDGKNPPDKTR